MSKNKKFSFFYIILLTLTSGCIGLKEFDEAPTPIGGKEKVRNVLKQALGPSYDDIEGNVEVTFIISINEEGTIQNMGIKSEDREFDKYEHTYLPIIRAMISEVKFSPATKNGRKIKAEFPYSFEF